MKRFTLIFCLALSIAFASAQMVPGNIMDALDQKGFIENKGQLRDASGKANAAVKFIYSDKLFNLQLTQKGFSYELFQVVEDNSTMDEAGLRHDSDEPVMPRLAASARIDVVLEQANPKASIIASNPTGAYFNFYHSPVRTSKIEQVKAFNTITYQNIYPGIDLVFYAPNAEEQTALHYDFIVHPGADPGLIRLRYQGASSLTANLDGSIRLANPIGFITEGKPVSFTASAKGETQQAVSSSYVVNNNHVSYQLENYDRTQLLTIDPTIIWGTYYGGENVDELAKITLDSKKKPLVTGNTLSLANIATNGAYQTTYGGGQSDIFVSKFKNNGKLEWATYFGGDDQDLAYGIAVDQFDNVIMIGKTKSDGLATVGQLVRGGSGDAIIVKFTTSGGFLWSTYKGGGGDDHFRQIRTDSQGYLYMAGYAESPLNIATPGAFQTVMNGIGDCMIAKYGPAGNLIWCTYFGAFGSDRFHALNISIEGDLLLQGTTESDSGMATPGAYQQVFGGGIEDVLLAKFDTTGHPIWSTYYGGAYSDRGRGVESDSAGNIYICGLTDSDSGIATPGSYQDQWTEGYYSGGSRAEDGYLAKFNANGSQLIWGTYIGDIGYDRIWGMTIDRKLKFIYGVGGTQSETNIATPGAWQTEFGGGGGGDGFFLQADYDGDVKWVSYLGAKSDDHLEDVRIDKDGFMLLGGVTNNGKMASTPGVHQTESNGGDGESILYKFYPGENCFDYNEPNETLNDAVLVSSWSYVHPIIYGYNGSIQNSDDNDWFKIKVKSNAPNIMIIVSDMTHNYDLKFFNKQKVLLKSSNNNGTTPDTIVYNNLAPATYYYKVSHAASEFDSVNCYLLTNYNSSSIFNLTGDNNRFPAGESAIPLSLNVFPNPASENLSFSLTAPKEGLATITICDLLGRVVKKVELNLDEGYQSIDVPVSGLPEGTYKLIVRIDIKTWIAGFVKQASK